MIELTLRADEMRSLAYVKLGELIASYRGSKPDDALARMERLHALFVSINASLVQQDELQRPQGRLSPHKVTHEEAVSLVHERLTGMRKIALASPARAADEIRRIVDVQKQIIRASREAAGPQRRAS